MKTAEAVLIRVNTDAPMGRKKHHLSPEVEALCVEMDYLKAALKNLEAILPRRDEA